MFPRVLLHFFFQYVYARENQNNNKIKQQLYASLHHIDAVRSRMKAERGEKIVQLSCFIQTEKKRSGIYLHSAKIDEVVR